ncbi:MAG: methyl-accepting chemotaxis protein [Spirochaetaceae bacterium]|jgi:methyl-accepting chemotaxis protein|nr:methyl-accepting chemotaxis protein [Spirochaetaceae bacterium]
MKLKYRLVITVVSILTVTAAALSLILLTLASLMQTASARESQERLAAEQARVIQARYERYLYVVRTLAASMSDYESIEPGLQRARFDQLLKSIAESEEQVAGLFAVFKPNTIDPGRDAAFAGTPGSTASGQWAPWYTRQSGSLERITYKDWAETTSVMNGAEAMQEKISEPVSQNIGGKNVHVVELSVPVINRRTGAVTGRAGVNIDTSYTQPVVNAVIESHSDITAMSVYSKNALIIASGVAEQIGKPLKEAQASLYNTDASDAEDAVINGKRRRLQKYSKAIDKHLEIIIYPFTIGQTGTNWSLMLGTDKAVIMEKVNKMTVVTIFVAAAAIVLMTVVVFFVSGGVAKPIANMADTLKDISEGEGDLTKTVTSKAKDETGDLALYFNATMGKIKKLVLVIKKQSILLFESANNLASDMTETAASINEIVSNINSIKERVVNQSASVTETKATMEQISANIGKLTEYVDRQNESVSRSSSAVEQMLANINSVTQTLVKNKDNVTGLNGASEDGREGLREVSADIQAIARESEGLLEINSVMENIASQTNLLSMNAAIEAAHAGEAGKGFAVVADEIRKLAENSGEQSKTISAVLKKIKDSIDKIMKSTDSVLSKFEVIAGGIKTVSDQEENIRNAMEEQSAGSKQVLEAIEQLNEATRMVKNGTEEMMEGSRQVMLESQNLEEATLEITNGMNEMSVGADQINEAITRVNDAASQNKESIEVLVDEVSKFKVE